MATPSLVSLVALLVAAHLCTFSTGAERDLYWEEACQFPKVDSCGIENQRIMGTYFEPGYTYVGSEYEKVMLLDSSVAGSGAARLITPYIKSSYKQNICLTLEYFLENEGLEKLSVIQQDRSQTRMIYQLGDDKKGKWRVAKMDLILRGGIVRFFLEGRVKRGVAGMAMIKSFQWRQGKCKPEYTRSPVFLRRSRLFSKYWNMQNV